MSAAAALAVTMEERAAPSRPFGLGTRRRKPRQGVSVLPEAGASRFAERKAPSLDTCKQLATTVANWLEEQKTPADDYQNRRRLWRQLLNTVHKIWQGWTLEPKDATEQAWWDAYEGEKTLIASDQSPDYDAWLEKHLRSLFKRDKSGLSFEKWIMAYHVPPEAYLRALYLEDWKKKNRPFGKCAHVLRWEKQYFQLLNCEGQWVGYKPPECCEGTARPVAVPVGCNHRLCPLCGWRRSQRAQRRMQTMFDRLVHPNFLTLTVPNSKSIAKKKLEWFRKRVRQFLEQHKEMFLGGVYAIETTYNRREKTWHMHAHVLVDQPFALPKVDQRVVTAGRNIPAFTLMKMALEFDWTRLWLNTKDQGGKLTNPLGKLPRRNASKMTLDGERFLFEEWVRACWANSLKEWDWRAKKYVDADLPADEIKRRTAWNTAHRRVFDMKPVTDRRKAAKEVLKYITKSADFCDVPEAVEHFYNAVKGARLIQTFGTWYGVDIDLYASSAHPEDWAELKCACGNHYTRMGLFQDRDVAMDETGRWLLKRSFDHNSAGTVPRPTIRALDERGAAPEEFRYGNNSPNFEAVQHG
jgi:hypothetical protein